MRGMKEGGGGGMTQASRLLHSISRLHISLHNLTSHIWGFHLRGNDKKTVSKHTFS